MFRANNCGTNCSSGCTKCTVFSLTATCAKLPTNDVIGATNVAFEESKAGRGGRACDYLKVDDLHGRPCQLNPLLAKATLVFEAISSRKSQSILRKSCGRACIRKVPLGFVLSSLTLEIIFLLVCVIARSRSRANARSGLHGRGRRQQKRATDSQRIIIRVRDTTTTAFALSAARGCIDDRCH